MIPPNGPVAIVRRHRGERLAACVIVVTLLTATAFIRVADVSGRVLLSGFLLLDEPALARWSWSGAWLFPVGNPYALEAPGMDGVPGFRVSRGITRDSTGRHDGADLMNGRRGDPVRAAAHGLVVVATTHSRGYGAHVVLAHRLQDGTLVYSVYAHLDPASLVVRPGPVVFAGQRLGRVGHSGRATTNHLHFEVRLPDDPTSRWEHAPAVDPIVFVTDRLPSAASDTSWARPYLEWAQCAALVQHEPADQPLSRATWWAVMARAVRRGFDSIPETPEDLRERLLAAGLLEPGDSRGQAKRPVEWRELQHDLVHLRALNLSLPRCPVASDRHRRLLDELLPPIGPSPRLGDHRQPPTLAEALLAIADLTIPADQRP